MKHRPAAVAICLGVLVTPAAAQPAGDCWTRGYPPAHFARAPGQTVERIALVLSRTAGEAPFGRGAYREGLLTARLRAGQTREVSVYCARQRGVHACRPSFGGAPILSFEERDGGASIRLRNLNIHLNPVGYSAEDVADDAVRLDPRRGDDVFILSRASGPECGM